MSFIKNDDLETEGVILKIFLTKENHPYNHVDCAGVKLMKGQNEFTFFPSEEEVLLFPYFGFLALNIEKLQDNDKIDLITLLEIPFQDNLDIK